MFITKSIYEVVWEECFVIHKTNSFYICINNQTLHDRQQQKRGFVVSQEALYPRRPDRRTDGQINGLSRHLSRDTYAAFYKHNEYK